MYKIINCCQISPFIFIINILLGFYCNYILYGLLFLCLCLTSIIHHTNNTEFTYIIDKISIIYIILYGIMLFNQKIKIINYNFISIIMCILIILTFLSVFYLYYYGYIMKNYCFHTDTNIAYKYHSWIHYITSLSHSLIMLL
jgi:hypothetical protein